MIHYTYKNRSITEYINVILWYITIYILNSSVYLHVYTFVYKDIH